MGQVHYCRGNVFTVGVRVVGRIGFARFVLAIAVAMVGFEAVAAVTSTSGTNKSSYARGESIAVSSRIVSDQALTNLNVIHKLVRYSGSYQLVAMASRSGVNLPANQEVRVDNSVAIPAELPAGEYHVVVDVFTYDWAAIHHGEIGAIQVGSVTATPTPVPTPVATATPAPTPVPTPVATATPAPTPSGALVMRDTTTYSSTFAPGSQQQIRSTITADRALTGLNVLHKLVRYSGSYALIAQSSQSNVALQANTALQVTTNLTVPAGTPAGEYYVIIDVFTYNWQAIYHRDIGTVVVGSTAPSPTPIPTATPAPTPAPTATPVSTPPPQTASHRVFISGHSLLWEPVGTNMTQIAQSLGRSFNFNQQLMSGSTIKQRTRGSSPEGTNQYAGYSAGFNKNWSTGLNIVNEIRRPQTFSDGPYDTLVITERHDLISAITYQDTVRYLRHYHDLLVATNPRAKTYFYEPWLSHKNEKLTEWYAYENEATKAWQCVSARINRSLEAEGRADRIENIPAARALAALVKEATEGNVAGVTAGSRDETLARLFTDDVHLTPLASYYVSLVTYHFVYGNSAEGAATPPGLSATQANSLQLFAQGFVNSYKRNYRAKSLTECQSDMRNVCSAYWNFDWAYANNPNMVPSCIDTFSQQNRSNPFYFDQATDRTFWLLPAP